MRDDRDLATVLVTVALNSCDCLGRFGKVPTRDARIARTY